MGLDRDQYRRDVRDVNYAARRTAPSVIAWTVAAIVVIAVIGVAVWYFGVATSGVKGAGDATKQTNSAANRLQVQAKYSSLYQGILAADLNIGVLDEAAKTDPSVFNKTNLVGAQNVCNQSVADYNAMAINALTAPWRPVELPISVGADQATDCKPNPINPTP